MTNSEFEKQAQNLCKIISGPDGASRKQLATLREIIELAYFHSIMFEFADRMSDAEKETSFSVQ